MTAVAAAAALEAAPVTSAVKVDHFGYRPGDAKIAVFSDDPGAVVEVRDGNDAVVLTIPTDGGSIASLGADGAPSGETVWWVDFSPLAAPGTYRLYSPSLGAQSYDFAVADDIYRGPMLAALKAFYRQRCNIAKEAAHAGAWSDDAPCHMGDLTVGPAAGHTGRGSLDLTGGWHDAGDYNKYVWTATSTAVLHLLRAFEENPGVFGDGDLGIPESANGVPDILDEVRYELDWLLKMQLPDGAVLSQLHVDGWASDSPPSADTNVRYYQDPTLESGAVLAGTCALAARVFADQGETTYANTLRTAAMTTWTWLQSQGDSDVKVWAAAEIFRLDPTRRCDVPEPVLPRLVRPDRADRGDLGDHRELHRLPGPLRRPCRGLRFTDRPPVRRRVRGRRHLAVVADRGRLGKRNARHPPTYI